MAEATTTQEYPRPDFQRSNLHWEPLNGTWSFIFDDEDIGLTEKWHLRGLPETARTKRNASQTEQSNNNSIAEQLASGTQEFMKDKLFASAGGDEAILNQKRTIQVPFVFQCPASTINDREVHEVLWYERNVTDPRTERECNGHHRVLLHFGAVDYQATVWVNGQLVGSHRGGHVPFDLDISDALDNHGEGSHCITVRVYDSAYDLTQPRGKQYWKAQPESIFYTPSGGIWQSVWLEVVPTARIGNSSYGTVLNSTDIYGGNIDCTVVILGRRAQQQLQVQIDVEFAGISIATSEKKSLGQESNVANILINGRLTDDNREQLPTDILNQARIENSACWKDGIALWTPEYPLLYDITIRLLNNSDEVLDQVKTTTGMRYISWSRGDGLWYLNEKPYFQALCLDQGYWPETFMTPPTPNHLRQDIILAKNMGFNGCRKHQKVEDPVFYYWADRLGYLVWGEMANAYEYSAQYVDRFNQEWTEAVKLGINHPSVVTWTPVNESWGYTSLENNVDQQNHIRSLYYLTKSLDSTRSINDNCGWEHVVTDLTTFHDYADGPELAKTCANIDAILDKKAGKDLFVLPVESKDYGSKHEAGAPIMCTEFGGVNIARNKGDGDRDWGYTTAQDPDDLLRRLDALIRAVVEGGHCCAFVYTQLTDIEQEANGLYSFDRKEKLDAAKVKKVIDSALTSFYKRIESVSQ